MNEKIFEPIDDYTEKLITIIRVSLKTYSANICVICGRIFPADFADYRR